MKNKTLKPIFKMQSKQAVRTRKAVWVLLCPAATIHAGMGLGRFEAL